jgi:hypothetical protein
MMTKDKELVTKYFDNEYELTDLPYFGYEVHIMKLSYGWKPLFEWHGNAYKSVEDMLKFLEFYRIDIEIFDEYGKQYTIEGLKEEFTSHANREPKYMKHIPEGIPNHIFGGRDYLVESTEDDYDIKMPYDHVEYHKLDPYSERRYIDESREPLYFHDKDGYDFTKGYFA